MTTRPQALLMALLLMLAAGCSGGGWILGLSTNAGRALPSTPLEAPPGFIYERVQAPLSLGYRQTEAEPPKRGEATTRFVGIPFTYGLLSFSWDDSSLEAAVDDGAITHVEYADYEIFNVLGVYSEFTVIAYGR